MTITRPNVIPDGLYTQAQAAKALGVDRHTVAHWAEEGIIKFRIRRAGRQKVTTGAQIVKCWESMYL